VSGHGLPHLLEARAPTAISAVSAQQEELFFVISGEDIFQAGPRPRCA
jgi:hypothetical protein